MHTATFTFLLMVCCYRNVCFGNKVHCVHSKCVSMYIGIHFPVLGRYLHREVKLRIPQMASQLPIVYRDLVRLWIAKMAERYEVEVFIPSTAQANRGEWDIHPEPCYYGELQDAFIDTLQLFEETQGYRVEALFINAPERQMMFQRKEYLCGVMADVGADATYDTLGAALACTSLLNHACERLIQHDAALLNSGYVEALVASQKIHTTDACQHICSDMITI
jgi:hypothetical protein